MHLNGGCHSQSPRKILSDYFPSVNGWSSRVEEVKEYTEACKEAKTYCTECWWCGEPVYYHTNGYQDHVLFDALGWPWSIHACWQEYWENEKERLRVVHKAGIEGYRLNQKLICLVRLKGSF